VPVTDLRSALGEVVGADHVLAAGDSLADYGHDESLSVAAAAPAFVARPGSTAEVAAVLRVAGSRGIRVTARGSGTGLSGAAVPESGGLVVSFKGEAALRPSGHPWSRGPVRLTAGGIA
jgi:glycolate oxidase